MSLGGLGSGTLIANARRGMKRSVIVLTVGLLASCGTPPVPSPPLRSPPAQTASPVPTAVATNGPPIAPVRDVVDDYFGVKVKDPYRWLEKQDDPEVAAWMKAQGAHTRRVLNALPLRAALLDRLNELDQSAASSYAAQAWNGSYFYLESPPGKDHISLFVRPRKGEERTLVDAEALTRGAEHASIDVFWPSPDGAHVVYGLAYGGSEDLVLHTLETKTGRVLPEEMDRTTFTSVSWADDRSYYYVRYPVLPAGAPESERYLRNKVYLHVLGTKVAEDRAVLGFGLSEAIPISPDAYSDVFAEPSGKYAFGRISAGGSNDLDIYFALQKELRAGKGKWTKLFDAKEHAITDMVVRGDDVYLLTHKDAPRFRVLRTSLKKPDFATAQVVVPETDTLLRSIVAAKDALYVAGLSAGEGRLSRLPHGQSKAIAIALPDRGPVRGLFAETKADGALFQQRSWIVSPRWTTFDPATSKIEDTRIVPPAPADFSSIEDIREAATSKDGVRVPVSIIAKKGLARDGSHPVWLDAYGAFGQLFEPYFQATRLAWLERGAALAVCHVRGGGELGEDWHKAGIREKKQNGIDDYIACAEHLIAEGWTRKDKLAGVGKSAGGLIIGNAITQRPDLFAAALIDVAVSDALRFESDLLGTPNVNEFGTVKLEEQFKWLFATSPYHHVEEGREYPAVMLTVAMRDARVSPWQPAKMAARLQASSKSGKPVLLRVDEEAGHFTTLVSKSQRNSELADEYAFFLWQAGAAGP